MPKSFPYVEMVVNSFVGGRLQVQVYSYGNLADEVLGPDLATATDNFVTLVTANMPPFLAADVRITGVTGRSFTTTDILQHEVALDLNGSVVGDSLPGQDVAEIQWHVERVGAARLTRGKTFISGCAEHDQQFGALDPETLGNIGTFAEAVRVFSVSTSDFEGLSIWSIRDSAWRPVTSWTVRSQVKTLRRRRSSS